ncbi:hypothetical protein P8831_15730 [Priestia megaterium]|uniref:hypothetical protein n=1 Tax=Priestia megaterium TaxID=1404 RepID=UPI002D7E9658|nr:hypothetical protein [Priestia megaterium]MEB4870176.1 hypothetical protein [Priestia megaterium]
MTGLSDPEETGGDFMPNRKNYKGFKPYQPNENEIITMQHSLRNLNHVEILSVLSTLNVRVVKTIKKRSELVKFIESSFQQGKLSKEIYIAIREKAFNPELNVSDGFYMAFDEVLLLDESQVISWIEIWNKEHSEFEENSVSYSSKIELIKYHPHKVILLVTRLQDKYAFDKSSMYSTKYTEEHQLLVEIHFKEEIIYFQTSNSTKYKVIRTIVQNFISIIVDKEAVKLFSPKMTKLLSFTYKEAENVAKQHSNINPNTVKLLDLLYDLDKEDSNFSDLECKDITFDHEDVKKKKQRFSKAMINTQNYGGGDLLATDSVKGLILNSRTILRMEFSLYYNEETSPEEFKKHAIIAGINSNNQDGFRIYIKNNDNSLKNTLNSAYIALKEAFIANYANGNIRNEDKIKSILGLDSSE